MDNVRRADNYRILVLYPTADRVCVFDVELELATRRHLLERKLAFRYHDIVAIEVATEPAGPELARQWLDQLNANGSNYVSLQIIQNEAFTLSVVNGEKVEISSVTPSLRAHTRTGGTIDVNQQFLRTVERYVWERRVAENR